MRLNWGPSYSELKILSRLLTMMKSKAKKEVRQTAVKV